MVTVYQKIKTKKGEKMKNIIISSILALSVIAFSGCTYKSASCNIAKPKLPNCVAAPCTPTPSPCGCHK